MKTRRLGRVSCVGKEEKEKNKSTPGTVFQGKGPEVETSMVQSRIPGEQQGCLEPREWGGVRMGWEEAEGEKGWVMRASLVMAKIMESPRKIEAGIAVSGCWQN